jgi:hypothetical protein
VRRNCSRRPPCHARKSPRIVLHLHVVEMVAGNAVQGQRRQAPTALRRVRRHPCLHAISAVRSAMYGRDRLPLRFEKAVHRGPVHRVHGAVHGARMRRQPLDLRSTVRLRPFSLRAPELLDFSKPVLPPLRIFTVRSWVLCFSPWPA